MLENNESPKSTYSYRAVGLIVSTEANLEARWCAPSKTPRKWQVRRIRLLTSPPNDILGNLTETARRFLSGFAHPSSCPAPAATSLPWNWTALKDGKCNRSVIDRLYCLLPKAKQTDWDFFPSRSISTLHPFFTWWNCKAETPASSVSVWWAFGAQCSFTPYSCPHPKGARNFVWCDFVRGCQQVSFSKAGPVCKPGALLSLQNGQGVLKLPWLLLPLLPSLRV